MEYNTARPQMIIPEYGRHVQKMAQHLLTIKSKKERTAASEVIIQTMTQVHPYAKDSEELRRKLWDHLYIITDYKLDVDGPYPKPSPDMFESKPKRLQYPASTLKYKHYGKITSELIKKAVKLKDGGEKDALVEAIAILMKKAFMMWNKSSVSDSVIVKDLREMSQGELEIKDLSKLDGVSVPIITAPVKQNFGRNNKRNKNNNDRRRRDKKRGRNGGF
ncbi:MAG TPA: DUF4290 domain-containing protein [Bacteroidia bacterium]|jgi:hypothetical protein|nr:DUF4290 domain-containing protein [Bacteroidia bacterium]